MVDPMIDQARGRRARYDQPSGQFVGLTWDTEDTVENMG